MSDIIASASFLVPAEATILMLVLTIGVAILFLIFSTTDWSMGSFSSSSLSFLDLLDFEKSLKNLLNSAKKVSLVSSASLNLYPLVYIFQGFYTSLNNIRRRA